MSDRDRKDEDGAITSNELRYILDINQKAVAIHLEVEQQNEQIISAIEKLAKKVDGIEKNVENTARLSDTTEKEVKLIGKNVDDTLKLSIITEDEIKKIEKSVFRLIIILSSTGIGLIVQIIQTFFHH